MEMERVFSQDGSASECVIVRCMISTLPKSPSCAYNLGKPGSLEKTEFL